MQLTRALLLEYMQHFPSFYELTCHLYNEILSTKKAPIGYNWSWLDYTFEDWRTVMAKATFISKKLTERQVVELKSWAVDNAEDLDSLEERLIHDGFKVSVRFHVSNDSFVYSVQPADYKYGQAGYILSRFHSTLWKARAEALFIHFVLTSGDWGQLAEPQSDAW